MDPLYKFVLDEKTGTITRYKITEYKRGSWNNNSYVRYRIKSQTCHCRMNELDLYKNNHVYTFNPDYKHAIDIIDNAIYNKLFIAEKTYEKWSNLYSKFKSNADEILKGTSDEQT